MDVTIGLHKRNRVRRLKLNLLLPGLSPGGPYGCGAPARVETRPGPLERIPADWVDLPEAPFIAEMRAGKAVLVNRTASSFNTVMTGCVIEQAGSVRVVGTLFGVDISHGVWEPGSAVEGLLRDLNNIDYDVVNQRIGRNVIKPCPPEANTAVTEAVLRGRYRWVADATKWSR